MLHGGPVYECALSPDGRFVVSAGGDGALKIWELETLRQLVTLRGHAAAPLVVTPDALFVVSGSPDSTLRIWNAEDGSEVMTMPLLGPAASLAVHPWAPFVVCGDTAGGVYLLELVGFEFGPIVSSITDGQPGPLVRCPRCGRMIPLAAGLAAGTSVACSGCATLIRPVQTSARPRRGERGSTADAYAREP
jgi:hypothetical protein